jgi:hypothetical protein
MEVGTKNVEKRPQRHKIVYEVLVVELEVLIRFPYTLRCFKRLTPIEQVTVLLRSNRVVEVLVQNLSYDKICCVKLYAIRSASFVFAKSNQLQVKNKEVFLSFLLSKPVVKVEELKT